MNKNKNDVERLPAIGVIPYGRWPSFNLSKVSLDELEWPVGRPLRLTTGTIGDLTTEDHILTFPRKPVFLFPRYKVKAKISVMIVEPDAVHGKFLVWSKALNWRFYKIFTKNRNLLNKIDNGVFYYFGSTFIKNINSIKANKTKIASLIASGKRDLPGHILRHKTVEYIRKETLNIDIMGRGYKPFENKEDGLSPYYYSVVIENVQERDYLSEKLIDACLCETIPIYWGCLNIENYLDPRGMIICNNQKEINAALTQISITDYNKKLEWVYKNKLSALHHANYTKRAAQLILQSSRK